MKKVKKELKNWIVYVLQCAGDAYHDEAYTEYLHMLPEMIRIYQNLCGDFGIDEIKEINAITVSPDCETISDSVFDRLRNSIGKGR